MSFYRRLPTSYTSSGTTTSYSTQPTIYISDGGTSTTGNVTSSPEAFRDAVQNESGTLVFTRVSGATKDVYLQDVMRDVYFNKTTNRMELRYFNTSYNRPLEHFPFANAFVSASVGSDGNLTVVSANGTAVPLTTIGRAVTNIAFDSSALEYTFGNGTTRRITNPTAGTLVDLRLNGGNDLVEVRANGQESVIDLPFANAVVSGAITTARRLRLTYANAASTDIALDFANAVSDVVSVSGRGLRLTYANGTEATVQVPYANAFTGATATSSGLEFALANGGARALDLPSANAVTDLAAAAGGLSLTYASGATRNLALSSANAVTRLALAGTTLTATHANSTQFPITLPNSLTALSVNADRNLAVTYASGATGTVPLDFSNAVASVALNAANNQLTVRHANNTHANVTLPSANALTDITVDAGNRLVLTRANATTRTVTLASANAVTDATLTAGRDLQLSYANGETRNVALSFSNAATQIGIQSNAWGNRLRVVWANSVTETAPLPFGNAVTAVEFNNNNDMLLTYANSASAAALRVPFANCVSNARITTGRALQLTYANGRTDNVALDFANSVSSIVLANGNSAFQVTYANSGTASIAIPFGNAVTGIASTGTTGLDLNVSYANGGSSIVVMPKTALTDVAVESNGLRRTLENGTASYSAFPFANAVVGVAANATSNELVFSRANASSLVVNLVAWGNSYIDARLNSGRQLSLQTANGNYTNVALNFANAATSVDLADNQITVTYANALQVPIALPVALSNVALSSGSLNFRYSNGVWSNLAVSSSNSVTTAYFDAANANRLVLQKESGALANVFVPSGNAVTAVDLPAGRNLRLTHANGQTSSVALNFANAFTEVTKLGPIDFQLARANGDTPYILTVPNAVTGGSLAPDRASIALTLANGGSTAVNVASFSNAIAALEVRNGNSEIYYQYANLTGCTVPIPVCFRDFSVSGDNAVFTWGNGTTKTLNIAASSALSNVEYVSNGTIKLTYANSSARYNDISRINNPIKGLAAHSTGVMITYGNTDAYPLALPFANAITAVSFTSAGSRQLRISPAQGGDSEIALDFANAVVGGSLLSNGVLRLALANSGANLIDMSSFTNPITSLTSQAESLRVTFANNYPLDVSLPATSKANIVQVTDSVRFVGISGTAAYVASANRGTATGLSISNAAGSALMYLSNTGDLRVIGDVVAKDVISLSDARLKSDQQPVTGALDRIGALRGLTYTIEGQRRAGVLAQDVQPVLPEAVEETDDGKLAVMYNGLAALYVEAFKELRRDVELLKAEVRDLHNFFKV